MATRSGKRPRRVKVGGNYSKGARARLEAEGGGASHYITVRPDGSTASSTSRMGKSTITMRSDGSKVVTQNHGDGYFTTTDDRVGRGKRKAGRKVKADGSTFGALVLIVLLAGLSWAWTQWGDGIAAFLSTSPFEQSAPAKTKD